MKAFRGFTFLLLAVLLSGYLPTDAIDTSLRDIENIPQRAEIGSDQSRQDTNYSTALINPQEALNDPVACAEAPSGTKIFLPLIRTNSSGLATAATGELPSIPDPRAVALDTSPTVSNDFAAETAFLYHGSRPVQTGVAVDAISPDRAAVLRGRACSRAGVALGDVQITIKDHPEYGSTRTRADGMFDLSVNGGELLTVVYTKTGYLAIQRQIRAPVQDYAILPDAVMTPLDAQVTTINLTAMQPQVARGSISKDEDGERRATLFVPQGTTAEMVLPNGTKQSLTSLTIRATEYTIGGTGPEAMPGMLPPQSGYTYAVEYSVDEALAAHALEVRFNKPLYHYNENFLGFPVGTVVPTGVFDNINGSHPPRF